MGEQLELERQIQYIDWVESFLQYQQQRSTPVQFLCGWQRHKHLR